MAGYGFAKKTFPGKEILFWLYVSSMMIPSFALLIPLFTLMSRLGLVNSYIGLIAPGLSAPFGVFLMRQFIQTLPTELIHAAKIDGASELRIFWDIIIPLSKPGLAVLGIFVFMAQWGAFLWPLIITNTNDMRTLPIGLALLANRELRVNYGAMMAAGDLYGDSDVDRLFRLPTLLPEGHHDGRRQGLSRGLSTPRAAASSREPGE